MVRHRFLLMFAFMGLATNLLWGQFDLYPSEFRHRVVVLGSSTSAGYGASVPDSAWVNRFRTYLQTFNPDNEVINLAFPGYSSFQLLPSDTPPIAKRPLPDTLRNITRALAHHPTMIIINLPSNDIASGNAPDEQINNMRLLREIAMDNGIPVWVTTTQPRNFRKESQRNEQLLLKNRITEEFDHVIDFWSGTDSSNLMLSPKYDSGDGTHLNDAGHRLIYERVLNAHVFSDTSVPFLKETVTPFSGKLLLELTGVASDGSNLPDFIPFQTYETAAYSGWTSKDRVYATRYWGEKLSNGQYVRFQEKIEILYAPKSDGTPQLLHASYVKRGIPLSEDFAEQEPWTEAKADVNYEISPKLHFRYQPDPYGEILKLEVATGNSVNIEFLRGLTRFYQDGSTEGTKYFYYDSPVK